jgi:hypothetical protein
MGMEQVEKSFAAFAAKISKWAGSSTIFISAAALIVVWGASGPYFGFSATWQMIVTTGTAICTFLMFLPFKTARIATAWRFKSSSTKLFGRQAQPKMA